MPVKRVIRAHFMIVILILTCIIPLVTLASADSPPAPALPDLSMPIWDPPSGPVERTFSFYNGVGNLGDGDAGPFSIRFYMSADTTISAADTLIGSRNLPGLRHGDAYVSLEETSVTIPPSVPAGSYYIGAIIDPANAVDEEDEGNNVICSHDRITLPAPALPDLSMPIWDPPSGPVERTFSFYNGVGNLGDGDAGPFSIRFYMSADTTISAADTLIGSRNLPGLRHGDAYVSLEETPVTIPPSVPAGSYYIGAIIDPANAVDEEDEGNNVICSHDRIIIRGPDLTTGVWDPPSGPVERTFAFWNGPLNSGGGNAGHFTIRFYISPDSTITTSDTIIGSRDLTGLYHGADSIEETTMVIPPSVPGGSYYLGMIIDPADEVDETDESNNVACSDETITIGDPVPATQLIVTKVADKAVYSVGDPVVFTVTVENPSLTPAENVMLMDYPPGEISLSSVTASLGTIAPGKSATHQFIGNAVACGSGVDNYVFAAGQTSTGAAIAGEDTATFDIVCGDTPVPEFPTLLMPAVCIIALAGTVYMIRKMKA